MAVDSPLFLFVFLPILLGVFLISPSSWRSPILLAASLVFYAATDAVSLPLFLAAAAFTMLMGLLVEPARGRLRSIFLGIGVVGLLGLLGWSKYTLFAISLIPGLEGLKAAAPSAMPLGVSFFVFSAISYLVDIFRRQLAAETNPLRFGLFLSFFPKIAAGPIARYPDMFPVRAPAIERLEDLLQGLIRLSIGLAKKVLLAAALAPMADAAFAQPAGELDMATAWLGLISYSLQLYFDFSGYTDMAVGLGRMFGYKLPENFNYPYTSQSVREFWRRWHMTLSTWFRDYLYIPLGGGRGPAWKVQRNLLAVFTLCGLWHGASLSFVVWGLWHGLFLSLERGFLGKLMDGAPRPVRHAYALLAVGLGWVFFRASDLTHAVAYMKALFGYSLEGWAYTWMVRATDLYLLSLAAAVCAAMPVAPWLAGRLGALRPVLAPVTASILLAAALLGLAAGTQAPFIYAQF